MDAVRDRNENIEGVNWHIPWDNANQKRREGGGLPYGTFVGNADLASCPPGSPARREEIIWGYLLDP